MRDAWVRRSDDQETKLPPGNMFVDASTRVRRGTHKVLGPELSACECALHSGCLVLVILRIIHHHDR